MSLDSFLYDLLYDIDKTKPPERVVDWEDGPLPYKLYRGLPAVPLSADIPLTLTEGMKQRKPPDLKTLGHFLWYSCGLAQLSHCILPGKESERDLFQMYRRFAPSGGALYPNECYVYLNIEGLSKGVYHYDAAHHRLVQLREGCFDSYLKRALGYSCDVEECFAVVFVTAMFWKNLFKYSSFSYRLQGLDAGAMIGQLLEAAKRYGYDAGVCFRFLDRAVNHLLGLSEQEESVYAAIALSAKPAAAWFNAPGMNETRERLDVSSSLSRELPTLQHVHYVRSRTIQPFPLLLEMNEAAMLNSIEPLLPFATGRTSIFGEERSMSLPSPERLTYDFAAVSRNRYSPDGDFIFGEVSRQELAILLRETVASFAYQNDLDFSSEHALPRVSLHVCTHKVEDLPDGAYGYDGAKHTLQLARSGDQRLWIQQGMPADNVNVLQVPLCFHVAGDRRHLAAALGYRGFRIQQMEAGMLVQRLLLTASALGLGGHPLLGYDTRLSDSIYGISEKGLCSLIQIPVGPYRPSPRLTAGLHG
ncbi:SagB family peptide dehydrogenase [Paenibacillus sp. UNC451MF]|uniref:SagB family peptide dehydrogenase n=1 Tax=Paenibacillus sp. UNC451MF TaxID=1449063 RepID=UPI00048E33F2|nr:SagB family peptide dehydrogenase [Paenibacillus sp. UNC451MF]